uniref:asparagine synthase-related protein n=2 Tax=Verminephrobacter aporrectodeae TaxID=1110389 RepID=UPI0002376140
LGVGTRVGKTTMFANRYKILLGTGLVAPAPDVEAISTYQHTGWVTRGKTFVHGIHSVPSGSVVRLSAEESDCRTYPIPDQPVVRRARGVAAGEIHTLSESAAQRFATHEERIGIALSSGVDSSYLAALVKNANPGSELHTFSVGYGRSDPELQGAEETARLLGTRHHTTVVTPEHLKSLWPEAIWHLEDPVGRDQYPCVLALSRDAASHVRTLYFGNGSDSSYGGLAVHPHLYWSKKMPVIASWCEDYLSWLRSSDDPRGVVSSALINLLGAASMPRPASIVGVNKQPTRVQFDLADDHPLRTQLAKDILTFDGHAGMKHRLVNSVSGCTVRMPFYDEPMVRHAFSLGDEDKIRWFEGKHELRRAAKACIPSRIAERPKRIQHLRYDETFSSFIDELADVAASREVIVNRGLFNPDSVARLRRHRGAKPYHSKHLYRLWYVIATELWARTFIDNKGATWTPL